LTRLSRAREADLSEFTRSLQGAQARAAAAAALEAESSAHSERSARETTQLRARLERERQLWEDERSKLVAALAEADAERADAEAAAQHAKVRICTRADSGFTQVLPFLTAYSPSAFFRSLDI
jgi:hypothetical protein